MDRNRKATQPTENANCNTTNQDMANRCSVCGSRFKSKSHFDSICNLCWADNEMRPYVTASLRRFYVN